MAETQNAAEPFILFELAGTTYALRSRLVRQMEMIDHITPVPNAPPFVEGLVFVRGLVVPAVNLRHRFGFARIPHDLRTRLVVVAIDGRSVGFVVDSAREFIMIPTDAIQAPPEGISGLSGKYLQGVVRLGDRLVLVLDVEQILNFTDFSVPAPQNS